jgi:hypothetical protein
LIDVATLAYTAGLFDGEGSIVIGCGKRADRRAPQYWLQVGITNTHRETIDWLLATFGGHISDNSHAPSRRKQRPCWAWRVMSNEAAAFLESLLPYLRIKNEQALIALEFQAHMQAPLVRPVPDAAIRQREAFRVRLRALTAKAPILPVVA